MVEAVSVREQSAFRQTTMSERERMVA